MAKRKKKNITEDTNSITASPSATAVAELSTAEQPTTDPLPADEWNEPVAPRSRPRAVDFNVPRSIAHDNQAGVRLLKFEKFQQFQLQLPPDAPAELDTQLKESGWRFRPSEGVYTKQYGKDGTGAAYVEARRLYQDMCDQLSPAGRGVAG